MTIALRRSYKETMFQLIDAAFRSLKINPTHGLQQRVKCYNCAENDKGDSKAHFRYNVTVGNDEIGIRFQEATSRPKRHTIRKLIQESFEPIVLIYENLTFDTIKRKIAKAILTAINRLKRSCTTTKFRRRLNHTRHATVCGHH